MLHPVGLSRDQVERFYEGFSNQTLWPLYHDVVRRPVIQRPWWRTYRDVNRRFAEAAAAVAGAFPGAARAARETDAEPNIIVRYAIIPPPT